MKSVSPKEESSELKIEVVKMTEGVIFEGQNLYR